MKILEYITKKEFSLFDMVMITFIAILSTSSIVWAFVVLVIGTLGSAILEHVVNPISPKYPDS